MTPFRKETNDGFFLHRGQAKIWSKKQTKHSFLNAIIIERCYLIAMHDMCTINIYIIINKPRKADPILAK